jgi:hypothetical protein
LDEAGLDAAYRDWIFAIPKTTETIIQRIFTFCINTVLELPYFIDHQNPLRRMIIHQIDGHTYWYMDIYAGGGRY